jgi:hypothetical protein
VAPADGSQARQLRAQRQRLVPFAHVHAGPDWRGSKALLDAEHARLRAALARLSGSQVSRRPVGSQLTWAALIRGIAAHDLYHAFQIQLLKRLQRGRKRAG